MAKKVRNIEVPEGFKDYYAIYSIDRKTNTRDIRKLLLQRQGELRSNMSNGSLNDPEIMKRLQEAFDDLANAVKTFKNDDRRKEYDAILDAAYETGRIDVEAQAMAQDLYEEIETLFMRGNYRGVIRKCMDALNNNVGDYRIYILLAQSYFALNDVNRSLSTVNDGLKIHPDNLPLLRAGARFSNEGKFGFDKAQEYINKMAEIDADNPLTISEQSYLYISDGKEDLAYKLIDEYVEKHPNDMEFRKDVAYDLVGHSYTCYTKQPGSDAYVIASEKDYQHCLASCNKAQSLYNDDNIQNAFDNAKSYGEVEFNYDNIENIIWLIIGGIIYLAIGVFAIGSAGVPGFLFGGALGVLLIYSGIRLWRASYRPYWQIYKYILTGKREKGEGKYILIGKIFAGYMKWSFKISWWLIKFTVSLFLHAF